MSCCVKCAWCTSMGVLVSTATPGKALTCRLNHLPYARTHPAFVLVPCTRPFARGPQGLPVCLLNTSCGTKLLHMLLPSRLQTTPPCCSSLCPLWRLCFCALRPLSRPASPSQFLKLGLTTSWVRFVHCSGRCPLFIAFVPIGCVCLSRTPGWACARV